MIFRAGEVLEGCAVIFGGDDSEIDLHSAFGEDAGLGGALAEDAFDEREFDEGGGDGFAVGGIFEGADDIDVADGFAPAAETAGEFGAGDCGELAKGFKHRLADFEGCDDADSAGGLGAQGDALLDGFDFLFADAFEAVEYSLFNRGDEFFDAGDLSLFPEE